MQQMTNLLQQINYLPEQIKYILQQIDNLLHYKKLNFHLKKIIAITCTCNKVKGDLKLKITISQALLYTQASSIQLVPHKPRPLEGLPQCCSTEKSLARPFLCRSANI